MICSCWYQTLHGTWHMASTPSGTPHDDPAFFPKKTIGLQKKGSIFGVFTRTNMIILQKENLEFRWLRDQLAKQNNHLHNNCGALYLPACKQRCLKNLSFVFPVFQMERFDQGLTVYIFSSGWFVDIGRRGISNWCLQKPQMQQWSGDLEVLSRGL